jgi:hypothetical protein
MIVARIERGGGRARGTCCLSSVATGRSDRRSIGRREERQVVPLGADFDHDQLHDELQFDRSDLSGRLRRTRFGAERRRDHGQQRHGERVVSDELFDTTAQLSDQLRPRLAVAIGAADRHFSASQQSFR